MKKSVLAPMFDHTVLKADATQADVEKACDEAMQYGFAAVATNGFYVPVVAKRLMGSGVLSCAAIGFPLGQMCFSVKAYEAKVAVENGAKEVDMVINVAALKAGDDAYVKEEIEEVRDAVGGRAKLKVILETCLLDDEQKRRACLIAKAVGADFVKTSTGFGSGGATPHDIRLMRETVGGEMGVKASGMIRTYEDVVALIDAGATRIGCSASVSILAGAEE